MGQWDQYIQKTINQAPVSGDGVPFLGIGKHAKLAIAEVFVDKTRDKGDAVVLYVAAIESAVHAPGTLTKVMFTINANGLEGDYSRERLATFVKQACNVQDPQQVGMQLDGMLDAAQKGRGLLVSADVTPAMTKDGKPRTTKRGEQMGNPTWFHVPGQTGEQIAQMRAALDLNCPIRPKRTLLPGGQPAVAATPPTAPAPSWPAPAPGGLPPGWGAPR